MTVPVLIDQHGFPIARTTPPARRLLWGTSGGAYDGADAMLQETRDWLARLDSPRNEVSQARDKLVARARDLVRNDGWAAGAVTHLLDACVGADLRLMSRPDWRGLAFRYGSKFDRAWAKEYRQAAEAVWRSWAYDPGFWCDAERRRSVPDLFRLGFRQWMVDGEVIASSPWIPARRGYGRARYATTLQLIDADRLSNPDNAPDDDQLRSGVVIDGYGAPIAYQFRRGHPGDDNINGASMVWDRVSRDWNFGRPRVVHFFESERPGQYRPAGGIFTPVLNRVRMLAKYDGTELAAAVINAIFAAFVESPADSSIVADALDDQDGTQLSEYQQVRGAFYEDRRLSVGGARVLSLFPGEKITPIKSERPNANFAPFQSAFLRNLSAATGQSFEQVSHDWSQSNYSSARGALLEAWRTMDRRRAQFARAVATPIFGNLMEEAMDRGELPRPAGAPDFAEARAEYSGAFWMGPARGWIDPLKEAEASKMRRDAGQSTLAIECAEQGHDWEEIVLDLAEENAFLAENGVTLATPTTMGPKPASNQPAEAQP